MQATTEPLPARPTNRSSQLEGVLILAAEVRRVAALARAMAISRRRVSLAGLENAVGLLCAKALDLPPDEVGPVRAQLLLLRAELDRLTAALAPNRARTHGVPHD